MQSDDLEPFVPLMGALASSPLCLSRLNVEDAETPAMDRVSGAIYAYMARLGSFPKEIAVTDRIGDYCAGCLPGVLFVSVRVYRQLRAEMNRLDGRRSLAHLDAYLGIPIRRDLEAQWSYFTAVYQVTDSTPRVNPVPLPWSHE